MKSVLLFDLDGTLTNPRPGIVSSIRYALERLDHPSPPDDALALWIGPPLRRSFATLLGISDAGQIERAMALYRERYTDLGLYENSVYQGIEDMLTRCQTHASAMFVATSKPTVFAERILQHFGLAGFFERVYGAELDGRFDNKTELLAHLLAAEGIPAATAAMIGDRAMDVVAAKTNGAHAVGVLWGYGSPEELRDAGADTLCVAPAELADVLGAA